MKLFFSYSPLPDSTPHHHHPPAKRFNSESFSGRFRVDFESFSRRDSKSTRTEKRLEIDSLGRGVGGGGGRVQGEAVAEKQFHMHHGKYNVLLSSSQELAQRG